MSREPAGAVAERREPSAPGVSAPQQAAEARPAPYLRIAALAAAVAALVATGLTLALTPRPAQAPVASGGPPARPAAAPAGGAAQSISTGPWGRLRTERIVISPPTEFLGDLPVNGGGRRWVFRDMTIAELRSYLATVDLTREQAAALAATAQHEPDRNDVVVTPSDDVVLSLTVLARTQIYNRLQRDDRNTTVWHAYRYAGSPAEWFADAQLPAEAVDWMTRLTYRNGRLSFFADQRLILPLLESPEQVHRLWKVLARESTLLVSLEIDDDSRIDDLVAYWGRGGRAKDVRPILESLKAKAGARHLDIVHLLPAFARQRLYSYPLPPRTAADVEKDCHWSALNFFSEIADDRYTHADMVKRTLQQDYYSVYGDYRLGDLFLYLDGSDLIHSAVYIADDILFTKNGRRPGNPWMLMRTGDMKDYYPVLRTGSVRVYRRNGL